jgi:serine/threonine protein kinase
LFIFYILLDEILGEIGEGSYGKIYLVIRKTDQKKLVLKRNFKKHNKDKYFANKFKNHNLPNVVEIYDCFYDKDEFCILMELCNNGPLSDFIKFVPSCNNRFIEESVFF